MLVVFGHSLPVTMDGLIAAGLVYSFHMPLFIILSAITCRYSTNLKSFGNNVKKAAKHLLIPPLIIFLLFWVGRDIYFDPKCVLVFQWWKEKFNALVYYRTSDGIGMPWFFIALFTTRILFDLFQMLVPKKMLLPFVILASSVGVALGKHPYYPYTWSFDIALAFMPFMYVGYYWNIISTIKISKIKKIGILLFCFIFWVVLSLFVYKEFLDIANRRYPIYPFGFLVAIAGSVVFMELSKLLEKTKIFLPLQFLGRYCIYFYCVHCVDGIVYPHWYNITNNAYLNLLLRIAIDLAFFLVLVVIHISITKIIQHFKFKKTRE